MNTTDHTDLQNQIVVYQGSGVSNIDAKGKREKRGQALLPMKKTTIDRIIYPVMTKRGIKHKKPHRAQLMEAQQA